MSMPSPTGSDQAKVLAGHAGEKKKEALSPPFVVGKEAKILLEKLSARLAAETWENPCYEVREHVNARRHW